MKFEDVERSINQHKKQLNDKGVYALSLFGSVARNEAKNNSDVDILIDFDSKGGMFMFIDVQNYLREILKCDVDLVTRNALRPELKQRIINESKRVF